MNPVQLPKRTTFDARTSSKSLYIIGRLEQLLTRNDELALPVTQYLTGDTSTEWFACWVSDIQSILRR
jgi:hypothetical protein